MVDRFYFSCTYCERPLAVNCIAQEVNLVLEKACPLCNEVALRLMGRVRKTDIVKSGIKAACDLRCTNAVGPKCDCLCGNENHGTHKLVSFDRVVGKLAVVNADMLNNNEEYLARIKRLATAKNVIKSKVLAFLNFKFKNVLDQVKASQGSYWRLKGEDYWSYVKYQKFLSQINKIEDLKQIQRKVTTLAKLLSQIGTNLELMEALYEKQLESVNG